MYVGMAIGIVSNLVSKVIVTDLHYWYMRTRTSCSYTGLRCGEDSLQLVVKHEDKYRLFNALTYWPVGAVPS